VETKERLSRDAVTAAALALADSEGLEAVTIRRLATDLGVTPMALYWHFKDKERLLDGVSELVLSEARLRERDAARPWDDELRGALDALLTALRAHPSLTDVVKTRVLLSEPGLELTERVLGALQAAGFTIEQASQVAMQALVTLVGLVSAEPGMALAEESEEDYEQRLRTKKAQLLSLSPRRFPRIVEAAEPLTDCGSSDEYFTFGVDVLMHGVRAIVASE
jgi:TetR/AcrR family tetracycline transcriptional repressor